MTRNETPLIPNPLSCLLFEDGESKRWIAHCLDFDLATSGKDEDAAWKNLKSAVRTHVEHCFTNWQSGLAKKASEKEFALFEFLRETQKEYRSDKISFNLIPPKTELTISSLWMHGFEGGNLDGLALGGTVQAVH